VPATTFDAPEVQGLLASRDIAVLATIAPEGDPLAMAMWFAHDAEGITMISEADRQKVRNMRRDPRVGVVVESVVDGRLSCVSVRGRASFVDDPSERARFAGALFDKYAQALEGRWKGREMPADRVMFRVRPERVHFWGYHTRDG